MSAEKRSRAAWVARLCFPHLAGLDVLEIACGTADFSLAAVETARSVTAIDLDDCRLSPAARSTNGVRFQRMDASAMTFPDGSFDTAVLYNALGHLTAILPEMLSEAFRILRSGGTLIVCSSFSLDKTTMEERFLPLLLERGLPFSCQEEGPFHIIEIHR